eukprot:656804-Hanusia_phi.AAC.3
MITRPGRGSPEATPCRKEAVNPVAAAALEMPMAIRETSRHALLLMARKGMDNCTSAPPMPSSLIFPPSLPLSLLSPSLLSSSLCSALLPASRSLSSLLLSSSLTPRYALHGLPQQLFPARKRLRVEVHVAEQ